MSALTPSRPDALPTTARLSLGRTNTAVATHEHLHFQLDHALARDAIHTPLDTALLERELHERGLTPVLLRSHAMDRKTYLRRPDLGRMLHPDSIVNLQPQITPPAKVLFLLADGLSALALERHALPLLDATLPLLEPCTLNLEPLPIVTNARVAIGDQIGPSSARRSPCCSSASGPGSARPTRSACTSPGTRTPASPPTPNATASPTSVARKS